MLPNKFSDLYEGDYLTALGHFNADRAIGEIFFILKGNYLGHQREFRFSFRPLTRDLDQEATHLCRLWASRKIDDNLEQISRDGAIPKELRTDKDEERLKRQADEIIELATTNGIINEYTEHLSEGTVAFQDFEVLVEEAVLLGNNGNRQELELAVTSTKLRDRAQNTRTGKGAVNQVMNKASGAKVGGKIAKVQMYYDADMEVVIIKSVQQIGKHSFFRRADRWVESAALDSATTNSPDQVVRFGTNEYDNLVRSLVADGEEEILALQGEILFRRNGQLLLLGPSAPPR